jgi:hypothetical protein
MHMASTHGFRHQTLTNCRTVKRASYSMLPLKTHSTHALGVSTAALVMSQQQHCRQKCLE